MVRGLVERHRGQPTLVIGQYLEQLDELAEALDAPVITGATTVRERQRLYEAFRHGEIGLLVVSKVANFSIDLPSAEVAIQVSGSFGSRQEEAQRLGRLLRPGEPGPDGERKIARFYTLVSRDTVDAEFAQNRQRFLAEQGVRLPDRRRRRGARRRLTGVRPRTARRGRHRRRGCRSRARTRPRSPPTGRQPDDDTRLDVECDVVVVRVDAAGAGPPGRRRGCRSPPVSPASL